MTTRRGFIKGAAVLPAAGLATPALAQSKITWRLQTYAGAALAEHVIKPAIDSFNKIAGDEMQIELYFADQLVPTGELFQAMQRGTIDAVQSDDDSMASPTDVTVFGGYFPFASRYSLDVPVLFNQYGLNEIWDEEYSALGVKHISAGAWDPCHFATKEPIRSLKDLEGKRVFTFPTAGRFMSQFGVVPVNLTLGFLFDDLISWRGSRFDRWLLRDGHFIHEGPDGTAMVPLRDITRVAPRTGRGVIVQLRDGRRLNLRYLPHPRETAAQIAGLLPPGTGTARN